MSAPGHGYGLPSDPRNNPYSGSRQPPHPSFPQPRREYDADSDMGDHYGSANSSTTRLAGSQAYYEQQNGQFLRPTIHRPDLHPPLQASQKTRIVATMLQSIHMPAYPAYLPLQTQVQGLQNPTPLGPQTARYPCRQRKSRTFSLTSLKSLVSNETLCVTW